MIFVYKLGTDEKYGFSEKETAYSALDKMLYTLNLSHTDKNAVINKTKSGLHLYLEHGGNTYVCRM